MTGIAMRQELHTYIDRIPETTLPALEPLLSFFANINRPVIETNLTDDEKATIREGRAEYKAHPETFVPLSAIS
jgi:hypothetical protein